MSVVFVVIVRLDRMLTDAVGRLQLIPPRLLAILWM